MLAITAMQHGLPTCAAVFRRICLATSLAAVITSVRSVSLSKVMCITALTRSRSRGAKGHSLLYRYALGTTLVSASIRAQTCQGCLTSRSGRGSSLVMSDRRVFFEKTTHLEGHFLGRGTVGLNC